MGAKRYINVISLHEFEKILEMFNCYVDHKTSIKLLNALRINLTSCEDLLLLENYLYEITPLNHRQLHALIHYFSSY